MAVKSIKCNYYKVISILKKDGKKIKNGEYDIVKWINKIDTEDLLHKTIDFGYAKARIEHMEYDASNKIWGMRILKLKSDNIPAIVTENEEAENIILEDDQYIGMDVNVLYEEESHILMVQNNRLSLSDKNLGRLITYINGEENEIISLSILLSDECIKELGSNKCRMIELGFAQLRNSHISEDSSLYSIIKPLKETGAYVAKVSIGVGRNRYSSLNSNSIDEIISDINDCDEVKSAKIKIFDEANPDVRVVDLLEECQYSIFPIRQEERCMIYFDTMFRAMKETFLEKKEKLI